MDWTAENLKWYFEQPSPRQADETLLNDAVSLFFPRMARIILVILPMVLLVVMGILLTFLSRANDYKGEWRLMTEPTVLTPGKVLHVETQRGSKGSITYVYRFEFKPGERAGADDPTVRGVCFSGSKVASPGQSVRVEYLPDNPKVSRIQGCRLNRMPLIGFAAMPVVVILSGFLPFAIFRYKKKWLHRLLTSGVLTPAIIERVKPGSKGALFVEVRYSAEGMEFKSKTNVGGGKGSKEWLLSLQESGQPVTILVDPAKPKSFFLLEQLLNAKRRSL